LPLGAFLALGGIFLFFSTQYALFCPVNGERVFYPPIGGKRMKVTDTIPEISIEKKTISKDQLQREFDYIRAQMVLEHLVQKGLISELEFNKITKLNRQSFTPALAQIMPENRCY
jgi:hypothetical protein